MSSTRKNKINSLITVIGIIFLSIVIALISYDILFGTYSINSNNKISNVVISKENIPVLFHDYRLNPDLVKDSSGNWITDKNMKLKDLTYEEISKYTIESVKPDTKYAKRFVQTFPLHL